MKRLMFVEDTYGVGFHRVLLGKLVQSKVLSGPTPEIRRLHAKKCNPQIYKHVIGAVLRFDEWKALIVIDSENRNPQKAKEEDFMRHVKRHHDRFKIVVVVPRHEAWLCLGLGGSRSRCRSRPEDYIQRLKKRPYEKQWLSSLAGEIRLSELLREPDFRLYIQGLQWLLR